MPLRINIKVPRGEGNEMKKTVAGIILMGLLGTVIAHAWSGSSTRIGNTVFHSNGTSSTKIGNSTFHSGGGSSTRIGNTVFHNGL